MKLYLYQTLEDRENPDEIEANGPFICSRANAWLGDGYYFWDTHIQLGHWWGRMCLSRNVYKDGYIICQADAIMDETCWDLHGNGNNRLEFDKICNLLVEKGITSKAKLLVAHVIEYLKNKGAFKYKAIRVLGTNSISFGKENQSFVKRIPFAQQDNIRYFDVYPPVQVCLIEKTALSLSNYSIVFPNHYVDTFA